jgi:hypothetical protein
MTILVRGSAIALVAVATACSSRPLRAVAEKSNGGPPPHQTAGVPFEGSVADGDDATPPDETVTPTTGTADAGTAAPLTDLRLNFWSSTIHTGFDGTSVFDVPIAAAVEGENSKYEVVVEPANTAKIKFSIGDTAIATGKFIPTPKSSTLEVYGLTRYKFGLITPKAAGTTTLTATDGTRTATAEIVITNYTPEQLALGKTRYNAPTKPSELRKPCTSCHGTDNAPSHDPFLQAGYSDEEILDIVTKGFRISAADGKQQPLKVPGGHMWNLTAGERIGVPGYLRSLPALKF